MLFPSFPGSRLFQRCVTSTMDLLSFPAICTSTWTGCPLLGCKAAGHLPLSRHEVLPGEFQGCRHRNEHEPEVQEEDTRPAQGETGAGAGVESVFSEDVARHRFRLVLRRSASPLSIIER